MYTRLALAASAALIAQSYALPQQLPRDVIDVLEARSDALNVTARDVLPEGMYKYIYPGSAFKDFENKPMGPGNPAVEHAPVFVYSRTGKTYDPCYPEGAINLAGNGPNPGTCTNDHGCASGNPGADCRNPRKDGAYNGKYTLGDSFPVYTTTCHYDAPASMGGSQWRINYDVYYVHDGALSAGHRHDWEGMTVIFTKPPGFEDPMFDWWMPSGAIYNEHSEHYYYKWDELESVDVDVDSPGDVSDRSVGKNRKHPKNYVGFFSHSAHAHACTPADTALCTAVNPGEPLSRYEYRGEDWWRLPRAEDIHLGSEIKHEWNYGHATSTPLNNQDSMCGKWSTKHGLGQLHGPADKPKDELK